jgi:hypothetical protein
MWPAPLGPEGVDVIDCGVLPTPALSLASLGDGQAALWSPTLISLLTETG